MELQSASHLTGIDRGSRNTGASCLTDRRALRPRRGFPPKPLVVIGLGNEIARDDGVGILTARRLERLLARRGDAEAIPLPWAGLALLDALRGRRRAALVDCLTTGRLAPGTVVRFRTGDGDGDDGFPGSVRLNSFHDLDFATALELGRELGWSLPEEIAVWAVEGGVVDEFGEGLSPPVLAAVDRVVTEILAFLAPAEGRGDELETTVEKTRTKTETVTP